MKTDAKIGSVLVVGGGVAGIQSALDLAESGFMVYLVESSLSIGGIMAQLDKTFPTNDCAMCILAPKLVEVGRHPDIELLTNTELISVQGSTGKFQVTVLKHPRFVDETKCIGCGLCAGKCPKKVSNEFDQGLGLRKAIYVPFPQAVPLKYAIDKDACIFFKTGKCRLCQKTCPAGAIDFLQREEERKLDVGSIIFSPGIEMFSPRIVGEYGYGSFANVITSMEFERILSASGPSGGHIYRPSDKREPANIAFIQCVGSRDVNTSSYCSAVCCTYAIKESIIAKEHLPALKSAIFFMDMRTYGKDFEQYYNRAMEEYGVRFVRSRVANIEEKEDKNLLLYYEENQETRCEEFELVVLSIGFASSCEIENTAKKLGIEMNSHGFAKTTVFNPQDTSRHGIYAAGLFTSPKDIPGTVAEASGAAVKATSLIAEARGTLVKKVEYPKEIDVLGQSPRIGVFVCHCGINIGSVVNVPEVVEYAKTLQGVVHAEHNLYTCSADAQERIKRMIGEHHLNRVVVAACTPRTHEPLFRNTCIKGGLNPHLFEMVNIREQCSWVHTQEKESATQKAKDLLRMAVAKSGMLEPVKRTRIPVTKRGIVIGGGVAGMTAALEIATQGFEVHLVEKERELGGLLRRIHFLFGCENPQENLQKTIEKVVGNKKIKVHLGTRMESLEGFVGNFHSTLSDGTKVEHGIIIVAVGGNELKPTEYGYGADPRVLTQLEFGERLAKDEFDGNTVVMIQCVGSRDKTHPYCSRVCCGSAVKNALKLKDLKPEAEAFILYRDMRTYGFMEDYYHEASRKGVRFLRFNESEKPVVKPEKDRIRVILREANLDETLELSTDAVILSAATLPNPDNEELSKLLKVPLNRDSFFLEAHMKLRPVDFATDGIFLAGVAHSPKFIDETVTQASAAAARACAILSKDEIEAEGAPAEVVEEQCMGCGLCVRLCYYGAPKMDVLPTGKPVSRINPVTCKGCGLCAASCPNKAIKALQFTSEEIMEQIHALSQQQGVC